MSSPNNFFNYLKDRQKAKGEEFTNTTLEGGKYYIDDDDYKTFLELYASQLYRSQYKYMSFTEKKTPNSGILTIDLDFRENYDTLNLNDNDNDIVECEDKSLEHKYNLNQIIEFCDKVVEFIDDFCVGDANITHYYIFERPHPRFDKDKIKDGIHIIFPNLSTTYDFYHYVRNKFIENNLSIY